MNPFAQQVVDVDTPDALGRAAAAIARHGEIAVDLEADSMHAFRARLCYVQLGTDEEILLVDTLAAGVRVDTLAPVFADPARTKFIHAAGNDLSFLAEAGVRVAGLFDTHLAATWLAWPKVGLADLAHQLAGAVLGKEHQQADFSQRPLPPELHAYIADDVRYLCEIGRAARDACRRADILEEVELACRKMAEEALARPETARLNVKFPAGLSPGERALAEAIAQALHAARLEWAEADDVPMGQVLSNATLTDIAVRPPTEMAELARRRNVRGGFLRRHGAAVVELVRAQIERGRRGELRPADRAPRPDAAVRRREVALKAFRSERAAARKVTPWVVLTNAHVDALAASPPGTTQELAQLPWFGDKRLALYGRELLELLSGA